MKLNPAMFTPYDPADHIKTDTVRAMYVEECLKTGIVPHIVDSLGVVARSRGMKKLGKEIEAMVKTIDESQGKEGIPNLEVFLGMMAALNLEFSVKPDGVVKKKAATKTTAKPVTKTRTKTLAKAPAKPATKRQKEMATATA